MKSLLSFLFCFSLMTLYSQGSEVDDGTRQSAAFEQYQNLLSFSDNYYNSGDFFKSSEAAAKAVGLAASFPNLTYTAEALYRQGRALMRMDNKSKNQAIGILEKSARLAGLKGNTALQKASLELLVALSIERNKPRDIARYEGMMKSGTTSDSATAARSMPAPPAPPSMINPSEAAVIKEKLSELSEQLDVQKKERDSLSKERQVLAQTISFQQKAIENMNEAQAKAQLILEYQKRMVDSLTFEKQLDSMQLAGNAVILQQKQAELQLKDTQRNLFLALSALVLILAVGLYLRYRNIKTHAVVLEEKNKIIQEERERAENLLLNILPAAVAQELKMLGRAQARHYDHATVMFTDFKNFTAIAEKLTPTELVRELDYCFKGFDQIIGKHGLEKIKTIGDAYMVVGGLPDPDPGHPVKVIQAAMEILQFLEAYKLERVAARLPYFEARVGIHTGPLVAGVVGERKFAYDVWGDTVNVAARMESVSEPGRINISAATFNLIQQEFACVHRGKIQVKNKGEVEMYFVEN